MATYANRAKDANRPSWRFLLKLSLSVALMGNCEGRSALTALMGAWAYWKKGHQSPATGNCEAIFIGNYSLSWAIEKKMVKKNPGICVAQCHIHVQKTKKMSIFYGYAPYPPYPFSYWKDALRLHMTNAPANHGLQIFRNFVFVDEKLNLLLLFLSRKLR